MAELLVDFRNGSNVLLELSARVQVIALTHHQHNAALAAQLPVDKVNIVHF